MNEMKTTGTWALTAAVSILMAALPLHGAGARKDVKSTKDGKVLSDTGRGVRSADSTFDGRKHVEPVKAGKSTNTRTAQQIAREENAKEKNRQRGLRIKEPPSPKVKDKRK